MRAILTYHSIDASGSVISVDPVTFERHMHWLSASGVAVLPLRDLGTATGNAVAITFDDGFCNFADGALPVLEELRLPATLFVVTGRVGTTNDWEVPAGKTRIPPLALLDWRGLARVAERGVEIGAHGRRHLNLAVASPADASDEILGAASDIEREIGTAPSAFAYPYGDWNAAAAGIVSQGYQLSCTTDFRLLSDADGAHNLPRLDMYYFRAPGTLESFGTPRFARYVATRSIGRTIRKSVLRVLS